MDYSKKTKQELVELLEKSISIDKYNKLEGLFKIKKTALDEIQQENENLKYSINSVEKEYQNRLSSAKDQYEKLADELKYMSTILNRQYEVTELLNEKRKNDEIFSTKLLEIYHKSIFAVEQKEEQ